MTRFTLYHTITDTLGRVHGHLYALDDGIQWKPPNDPVKAIESVKRGGESNVVRQSESTKRMGQASPNVSSNKGQRQKLREREFEIEQRLQQLAEERIKKRHLIII